MAWAIFNAVTFSLLWHDWAAVLNRLGFLYTTLGSYILLRALIRNKADALVAIRTLAVVLLVIAPGMLIEHFTGHNSFDYSERRPFRACAKVISVRAARLAMQSLPDRWRPCWFRCFLAWV